MKGKHFKTLLAIEALACIFFCVLGGLFTDVFTSALAFPFEQIGAGLRTLSLSGGLGNIAAIIIYVLISLLPIGYLLIRLKKARAHWEEALLVLLSAALFAVIYMMINPGHIANHFGLPEFIVTLKSLLGMAVYSISAGYIIMRALRSFSNGASDMLLNNLKILLGIICAVLVFGIFGSGLDGLFGSFKTLADGNTGAGNSDLTLSYGFLILQYFVSVLPYAFDTIIIFGGFSLINALAEDPYGEDVAISAQKTGHMCRIAVIAIMVSQIVVNVLQLLLGARVRAAHYTLSIPLMSVVFVLIAMLLADYFHRARMLKDDNDSII